MKRWIGVIETAELSNDYCNSCGRKLEEYAFVIEMEDKYMFMCNSCARKVIAPVRRGRKY